MTILERVGPFAQLLVSVVIIAAFLGTIYALLFVTAAIEGSVREVLLILVGVMAGAFKDVVGFWLGSSYGSARKTDALTNGNK